MKWYTMTKPDDRQGLIADEKTGANIAVSYDPKHAQLIAAAPQLLKAARGVEAHSYANDLPEAQSDTVDGQAMDELLAAIAEAAEGVCNEN